MKNAHLQLNKEFGPKPHHKSNHHSKTEQKFPKKEKDRERDKVHALISMERNAGAAVL